MPNLTPSKLNNSRHVLQSQLGQYVYFSPLTTGTNGRAVKINKELFLPFFCCVDPSTHDGQLIIRQIENLRAAPAHSFSSGRKDSSQHIIRLSKINSGFEHLLIVKNLHIYYRVSQEQGDSSPCIYISDIRELSGSTSHPSGLYLVNPNSRRESLDKVSPKKLDGKSIFVSGKNKSPAAAFEEAKLITNQIDPALFYSDANALNDLGVWRSKRLSHSAKHATQELIEIFNANRKPFKGINWFISEEGASVLESALRRFDGDLSNHNFKFFNAIAKTSSIVENLSKSKAVISGEFFNYSRNQKALVALSIDKDQLLASIGKLPAAKNYDRITRRYIVSAIESLARIGGKITEQSPTSQKSINTFVHALISAGKHR